MLRARRMGSRKRATQTGRGMRIVSTKQDVGMGEEILECGPCVYLSVHPIITSAEKQLTKPSTRWAQSFTIFATESGAGVASPGPAKGGSLAF
jgi:hypothetical protein